MPRIQAARLVVMAKQESEQSRQILAQFSSVAS
jgi:hypothetical protein